jgi:hypothetical protein
LKVFLHTASVLLNPRKPNALLTVGFGGLSGGYEEFCLLEWKPNVCACYVRLGGSLLGLFFILQTEATYFSETFANIQRTTLRYAPEDRILHFANCWDIFTK